MMILWNFVSWCIGLAIILLGVCALLFITIAIMVRYENTIIRKMDAMFDWFEKTFSKDKDETIR